MPPKPTLVNLPQKHKICSIKARTGLTEEQFIYVLDLLREIPEPIKRGRELLDLDFRLAITLQWIQLGQMFHDLGDPFKPTASRVQTAITITWNSLAEVLFEASIPAHPRECNSSRNSANYPEIIGALDVTLLPLLKPRGKKKALGA